MAKCVKPVRGDLHVARSPTDYVVRNERVELVSTYQLDLVHVHRSGRNRLYFIWSRVCRRGEGLHLLGARVRVPLHVIRLNCLSAIR